MIEHRLLRLSDHLDRVVEPEIVGQLRKEVSYGEYGMGLENLCQQLFEADARLPKFVIDEIGEIAGLMDLPADRWEFVSALEEWPEDAH